jgi:hypothetical protein
MGQTFKKKVLDYCLLVIELTDSEGVYNKYMNMQTELTLGSEGIPQRINVSALYTVLI